MDVIRVNFVAFCLAFWCAAPSLAQTQDRGLLRVLIPDSSAMPFAQFVRVGDKNVVHTGLEKDWADALARQMGRVPEFVPIPAKRVVAIAAQGGFDLQCFQSPDWYGPGSRAVYEMFPDGLLSIEERLVGLPTEPVVHGPTGLAGKRIGVVLGYRYPALATLLAAKDIQLEEAPNEVSLLQKQLKGRANYSVLKSINLAYARKRDPAYAVLVESPWVVSRTELHCMRVLASPIPLSEMVAAHRALVAQGTLNRLLASYR
jgi:polar amino acid transport system substrate-binding protein